MQEIHLIEGSKNPFKRAASSLINLNKGLFVLFGGANRSEQFGDIWQLDLQEGQQQKAGSGKILSAKWTQIEIPLSAFTPRTGQCADVSKEEGKIYIFGGQNFNQNKHYNDFFLFENAKLTFTNYNCLLHCPFHHHNIGKPQPLTTLKQPQSLANTPSERNSSTLCYDKVQNKLYLFAGADAQEPLSDLFCYDVAKKEWKSLQTTPANYYGSGLEMHTAHIYHTKSELKSYTQQKITSKKPKLIDINIGIGGQLLEGGAAAENVQATQAVVLHKVNIEFDPANVERDDTAEGFDDEFPPPGQSEEGFVQDEQNLDEEQKQQHQEEVQTHTYLIVIGGRSKEGLEGRISALNLENLQWTCLRELPAGLKLCAHASVLVGEVVYLFGGTDGQTFIKDLYLFDINKSRFYAAEIAKTEAQALQTQLLSGRMACAMSYDEQLKKIIIFGGSGKDDESSQIVAVDVERYSVQNGVKKIK